MQDPGGGWGGWTLIKGENVGELQVEGFPGCVS